LPAQEANRARQSRIREIAGEPWRGVGLPFLIPNLEERSARRRERCKIADQVSLETCPVVSFSILDEIENRRVEGLAQAVPPVTRKSDATALDRADQPFGRPSYRAALIEECELSVRNDLDCFVGLNRKSGEKSQYARARFAKSLLEESALDRYCRWDHGGGVGSKLALHFPTVYRTAGPRRAVTLGSGGENRLSPFRKD
jgi:hypothetical protein